MVDLKTNVDLGRRLFGLRDTVNDKLYNAIVQTCRVENIEISEEECKKVVFNCQAEITKLFDAAVGQFIK